jgi:hypothetical protein
MQMPLPLPLLFSSLCPVAILSPLSSLPSPNTVCISLNPFPRIRRLPNEQLAPSLIAPTQNATPRHASAIRHDKTHSTAQHSTAQHSTAQHGDVCHTPEPPSCVAIRRNAIQNLPGITYSRFYVSVLGRRSANSGTQKFKRTRQRLQKLDRQQIFQEPESSIASLGSTAAQRSQPSEECNIWRSAKPRTVIRAVEARQPPPRSHCCCRSPSACRSRLFIEQRRCIGMELKGSQLNSSLR